MSKDEQVTLFRRVLEPVRCEETQLDQLPAEVIRVAELTVPRADFIESVRIAGRVIVPVVFQELPGGRLRLVEGKRRIHAAIKIGLESVPACFYRMDATEADAITVIANAHRSANVVAELEALERLMGGMDGKDPVADVRALARALALPVGTVRRRLKLRALVPALREALEDGRLKSATAMAAATLPINMQRTLARTDGRITAHAVRECRAAERKTVTANLPAELFEGPADVTGATMREPVPFDALVLVLGPRPLPVDRELHRAARDTVLAWMERSGRPVPRKRAPADDSVSPGTVESTAVQS